MEEFKISLFEKEHNTVFPSHKTLSEDECKNLRLKIIGKYDLEQKNMANKLFSKQNYYADEDASEDFNLIETLDKLEIHPEENVYIDWYNFERIDLMAIKDLSIFFYDVWYPVADDINIFDESLDWLIFIRHDGTIYYIKNKSVSA